MKQVDFRLESLRKSARIVFGAPALDDEHFLDTRNDLEKFYSARTAAIEWAARVDSATLDGATEGLTEARNERCR